MSSNNCKLIALTGGIGTGKSVVAQLLRVMGYEVYDCDERARWVMTHDAQLRQELIALFGPDTYLAPDAQGLPVLNKPYLSSRIFADAQALQAMNACVPPAVARDLQHRHLQYQQHHPQGRSYFFESAILFESGFDQLSHPDQVWVVTAPLELRIQRASLRDHAPREQILARIQSQMPQAQKELRADHIIYNDDSCSLIEQVQRLVSAP